MSTPNSLPGFAALPDPCMGWLAALGFETPTPVQTAAIPTLLEGRSVHALAPTGTGKTLAFLLPLFARIDTSTAATRLLVLVPTRELGQQIAQVANALAPVLAQEGRKPPTVRTAFGGQKTETQRDELERHPHVVIATPGRALEFVRSEVLDLRSLTALVLDEADRMVGMGFASQVEAICAEAQRGLQTALFSATESPLETSLAEELLRDAHRIDLREKTGREHRAAFAEHQILKVASNGEKYRALSSCLRAMEGEVPNGILFCATRENVSNVRDWLAREGHAVDALSGELGQIERSSVLRRFKAGGVRWLVATNVAARGIDVSDLGFVVNVDLPATAEDYVHRAGRTGRAGKSARVLNVCAEAGEGFLRRLIEGVPVTLVRWSPPETLVEDTPDGARGANVGLPADPLEGVQTFSRVHLNRGKSDKLRAGDVVGALTKQLGLAGAELGGIYIYDHFTHVDVVSSKADAVIRGLEGVRVKTLTVKASRAKT